jgi:urease accessory protein
MAAMAASNSIAKPRIAHSFVSPQWLSNDPALPKAVLPAGGRHCKNHRMDQAQRAHGRLALTAKRTGAATRLATLYQEGCLKARLPRPRDAGMLEAVTINISGGIAGGDDLGTLLEAGPHACVSIATQAAERHYRALGPPARLGTRLIAHPHATLHYLPQETILFDGFALDRSLDIELHETASFIGLESLVFGRQAMGEIVRSGHLRDRISLRRGGKLILQDMSRLDGDIAAQLGRPAIAGGATAMATLILAGPAATARLDALRAALAKAQAGATSFEKIVFVRILAPNGASLRNDVLAALAIVMDGAALPRVWAG